MGGVLTTIILINVLAIFTLLFKPTLLEVIQINEILGLAGLEIVIVAIIGYISLILSHRIAGPAYAVVRDLTRLADGDLTVRTHLRKGDFHTEVAEAFNLASQTLCSKIKTIEALLITLQQRSNIDEATRQALLEVLQELNYFNTEPLIPTSDLNTATHANNALESGVVPNIDNAHTGR